MYQQVETDKIAIIACGDIHDPSTEVSNIEPVATLADSYGGRCQIAIDDHCYVLYLKRGDAYKKTPYIFREAFEVLSKLPSPK